LSPLCGRRNPCSEEGKRKKRGGKGSHPCLRQRQSIRGKGEKLGKGIHTVIFPISKVSREREGERRERLSKRDTNENDFEKEEKEGKGVRSECLRSHLHSLRTSNLKKKKGGRGDQERDMVRKNIGNFSPSQIKKGREGKRGRGGGGEILRLFFTS